MYSGIQLSVYMVSLNTLLPLNIFLNAKFITGIITPLYPKFGEMMDFYTIDAYTFTFNKINHLMGNFE